MVDNAIGPYWDCDCFTDGEFEDKRRVIRASAYEALEARCRAAEDDADADKLRIVHANARLRIRIDELEAALRQIRDAKVGLTDQGNWFKAIANAALMTAPETPVSTLCAVCDQIKELHPNTHPWTAKETKVNQQGESNGEENKTG